MIYYKATINWCENDYVYSSVIAEFWNTLTGLCLCVSPVLFYYNKYGNVHLSELKNIFVYTFMVGVGTILFHSTLLYIFQIVDEIPMLLVCVEYYMLLSRIELLNVDKINWVRGINKNRVNTKGNLFKLYIMFIFISGYINNTLQILLFQFTVGLFVFILCIKFKKIYTVNYNIYYKLTNIKNDMEKESLYHYSIMYKLIALKNTLKKIVQIRKRLTLLKNRGLLLGLCSIIIWNIDNEYCEVVNKYFNGHAMWHILTSISLYVVNEIVLLNFEFNDLIKMK